MRVSKQLQSRLLTSTMAVAITMMPTLFADAQEQGSGFKPVSSAASPSSDNPVDWLDRANTAMKSGNFLLAEQAIEMAEQLTSPDVQLSWTPAMARKELAMIRQAATNAGSENAMAYLLKARQSLAIGDVRAAAEAIQLARQSGTDFSGSGDTPEMLDAMIARQNRLVELYQQGSADSGYDTEAAKFLMEQAEILVKYRDFKTSRVLAEQAKKFTSVDFSSFSMTPDRMLQIIDIASQTAVAEPVAPTTPKFDAKSEVARLMAQAQLYVDQANWTKAKELVQKAKSYNLGDDQFAQDETRPWQLDLKIENALSLQTPAIPTQRDASVAPASFTNLVDKGVEPAKYDPATDPSQVVPASVEKPTLGSIQTQTPPEARFAAITQPAEPARGVKMFESGVAATAENDVTRAREFFQLAMQYPADLTQEMQQTIETKLTEFDEAKESATQQGAIVQTSVDEEFGYALNEKSDFAKLQAEVMRDRQVAERMLATKPREAMAKISMLRTRVASAQIEAEDRRPLIKIVDRDITKFQNYIDKNLSQIQNDEAAAATREEVDRIRQRRLDVDEQLNRLVDDFNKLMDEMRFAEAELIARQADELAPNDPTVAVMREKVRVVYNQSRIDERNEMMNNNRLDLMDEMLNISRGMRTDIPLEMDPNADDYIQRMRQRAEILESQRYSSPANRIIWNKLKNTDVEGEYVGTLNEAMDQLSRQAGLNIVFDTLALETVQVSTEQNINVPIRNPISLESALNVILSGVGLEFVVEDEVIKVTSSEAKEAELITKTYYVGDLLMPLKNYRNPNNLSFMQPTTNTGYSMNGGAMNVSNPSPANFNQAPSQIALQQQLGNGGIPGLNPLAGFGNGGYNPYGGNDPQRGTPMYGTINNQGQAGGITQADFQVLMNLIQQTVDTESWELNGQGNGTMQPFAPNLSLIVTQSQKVQDEIRDLLEKLRELNDVQIVIEVRFVAIQDNFFERIGIDFDFSINDNSGVADPTVDTLQRSTVVGNTGSAIGGNTVFLPTNNQDIQFTQGSVGIEPAFGGFDLASAANFGFAILSDIEVYFLIQASKGSTRATVTEAPTVVMFNGQSASVNDTQNRSFVTSVQPVVGDFAVAQMPVITILPDGTNLNVTATVSADRRSVQMSLVPFFSEIVSVEQFTFTGTTRTERSTNSLLDDLLDNLDPTNADDSDDEIQVTNEGVTIQLPVLATTSVNTVVSVPDGGTILMGGIKRMREERTERGVPMLSSIPYLNRLFTNVAVGRETTNLMMMVTPRIIIQSEEEQKQIGVFGDE